MKASGHQLAQLAGLAYSSVHAELEAMKAAGLVSVHTEGRAEMFTKNGEYPDAVTLTALLQNPKSTQETERNATDEDVQLNLVRFGAPLGVNGKSNVELSLEETLVLGLKLARQNSTVTRVLPVVFAKNRNTLDLKRLEFLAQQHHVLPVLGFFLDLTSVLTKNKKLHAQALKLVDRRRKRMEYFFVGRKQGQFEKELTEMNTPDLARKWLFFMNMGMDSFETLFRKNFPVGEFA